MYTEIVRDDPWFPVDTCGYNQFAEGPCLTPDKAVARDGAGWRWARELPKLNVDLLERCWGFVKEGQAHTMTDGTAVDATWLQRYWTHTTGAVSTNGQVHECGSSFCVAGFAAHVTGNVNITPSGDLSAQIQTKEFVSTPRGTMRIRWDDYATLGGALLGLTEPEANRLFAGGNNREDVRVTMNAVAAARNEYVVLTNH